MSTYGVRRLGLPPYAVRQLRRLISASLPGQHLGRSTMLRLAMYGSDPQHEIASAPLATWASAIWDSMVPPEALQTAWQRQQVAVGLAPSWRKVSGPARACIMTMQGIGWKWPRWDCFLTPNGHALRLDEVCPADTDATARLDSDAAIWAAWTTELGNESLAPRPFIEPIAQHVHSRRARGTAASVAQTGFWTQDRLHELGLAEVGHCQLCGPGVLGTAHHRRYCCPGLRQERLNAPRKLQHRGKQASPDALL